MTAQLPNETPESLIPEAVRADFDIVRPLGQGGMGSVWLAHDRLLDRLVAIKVLLTSAASDATRERFLREARTAAKLSHPNIVPVHRADESNGQVWFSMGFVDGESLGDRIRERGALPFTDVVRIMREAAWALAYAHARGVIHRDVKPDNIMLDRESGRTLVTDFGIARDLRADDARLTADGSVLGTVDYMSPEQAADDPLDARSDVYALGVVGFHALSNRLPFEGLPNAVLIAHVTKPAPTLRSVAPQVPAPIAAVIDRCLLKTAADRWENAEALADALGTALDDMITADRHAVKRTTGGIISERDAVAVWQRAAQLQAEAAHRMERSITLTPSPAGASDAPVPTDAFRLSDVEAAAVEAGISRQFVAIAIAERSAGANAGGMAVVPLDDRNERRITTILGTTDRSLSVARVIGASPKETLALIGRIFTAQPYLLTVRESVNGHPLDGGILRFDIPNLYRAISSGNINGRTGSMVGMSHALIYQCLTINLTILNVTLKARGTPSHPECEVIVSGDLRDGQRKKLHEAYWSIGVLTTVGGGTVLAVGAKLLGGILLATPLGAGVAVVTAAATMIGNRALSRRALRKAREEIDKMLLTLQQQLDRQALFGDQHPPDPTRRVGADDDATLLAIIAAAS